MQLLRLNEVCSKVGVSRATLYRRVREGSLPAPVHVGPRTSRWRLDEIDEYIANLPKRREAATV